MGALPDKRLELTIEYRSTRGEVASWYWYSLRYDPKHLASWLFCVLSVGIYVFVTERKTGSMQHAIMTSLLWVLGLAAFFALYPQLLFKPRVRRLTIAPDGISTSISGRSRAYRWSEIRSLVVRGDQLYVGFGSLHAFVVPARAFNSDEARREFIRLCAEWRKGGVGVPAA